MFTLMSLQVQFLLEWRMFSANSILIAHILIQIKGLYRPAEGGKRACNSRTSCMEGEMLAVTQNLTRYDVDHAL